MIGVDEALETILAKIHLLESQERPILDAVGSVLAQDVTAEADIPPFDNSAMDGYAVVASDVAGASDEAPVELKVLEDVPAGYVAKFSVAAGAAARIMTGAPMPAGADAVVMVEYTEQGNGTVSIKRPVKSNENVRFHGEDVKAGETVLVADDVLRPAQIGLLAAVGCARARVVRTPVIGVLSTGDEVIELDQPLAPGKIRNSNSYSLAAQVIDAGGIPKRLGIARDTEEDVMSKLEEGLGCDALITTGGVSVGDYDMVKAVLSRLGEMVFWKVAMRPGQPLAFGIIKGTPVFGLPGNPTSSMISFEQFVKPAIRKMAGHTSSGRTVVRVIVEEDIKKKPGKRYFLRAVVERRDGVYYARLAGPQGSGMLKPIASADGLLVLLEDDAEIKAGETATVQLLHPIED